MTEYEIYNILGALILAAKLCYFGYLYGRWRADGTC